MWKKPTLQNEKQIYEAFEYETAYLSLVNSDIKNFLKIFIIRRSSIVFYIIAEQRL